MWEKCLIHAENKNLKLNMMKLNVNIRTWESSEERINENYTQRHSNVLYEQLVTWIMQERSMSILRGYSLR